MAFCSTCGAQIPDGATTCAACAGRAATASATTTTGGISENAAGMLSYFTIFGGIIFLVIDPYNKSRFVRFHAWQCIFFNLSWIVLWMVLRIMAHVPLIGWLTVFLVWPLVFLGGFILWLILVLKANQGQMFKLPVIGDLAEKQAFTM
jgi:uncharacterized membrane protein